MRGNSLVRGFVYRGSTVTIINKAVARVPVPESLLFHLSSGCACAKCFGGVAYTVVKLAAC